MPSVPPRIVGQLRQAALADAGLSDGQLLDAYLARRDEAAFECLVWRHGPAVLGACRRFLGNDADAEDAFQATFLVLVRKAPSVRRHGTIGAWLYGVACNVARKARANAVRRRAKELAARRAPPTAPAEPDVRPMIDDEVNRLPEKYRVPIVLCELEGQPIADAARQLGWPQGTVASRLARGRDLLARRLTRHGLSLVSLSTAALTADTVAGALQAARGSAATANRLADGIMRAMSLTNLKPWAAAVACAAAVLIGGVAYQMRDHESGDAAKADPPPKAPKSEPSPKIEAEPMTPKTEPPTLIGRWRITGDRPYRVLEFREQPGQGLLIAEKANHDADWFSWVVDTTKNPKEINLSARVEGASNPNHGIYTFDGDRLVIYLGAPLRFQGIPDKHTRPTSFHVEGKPGERYLELERETVAWGPVRENGIQYGLLAEPNGRTTAQMGESVPFRVYARNTTNKAVDLSVTRASDTLPAWPVHVRDEKANPIPVMTPVPPPGFLPESARLRKKLLDYQVADVGAIHLTFLTPEEFNRAGPRPIHLVPVAPGTYSIHLGGEKNSSGGGGPTGVAKLKVEPAIGWGREVKGLQFGLALGKGQSSRIHIGERARFRMLARNTTEAEVTVGTLKVLHLPMYAKPTVVGGEGESLEVKHVRGPNVNPPPPNLKVGAKQTVELPGEFVLPFLPHRAPDETHVIAKPGRWTISVPNLDTWTAGAGYGTGPIPIEILPGDVGHTDSQGVAWGKAVDGLQFGIKFDPPDRKLFEVDKSVDVTVVARNMSVAKIAFELPEPEFLAQVKLGPTLRNATGKDVPATQPPRDSLPRPLYKSVELPIGATVDVYTTHWRIDRQRPEGLEPYFLVWPGEYSLRFDNLSDPQKSPAGKRPTGELKFTVK